MKIKSPNSLLETVQNKNFKIIFVDLFDTLLHRTKHPNYCLKLWAKYLIQEFGLTIEANELFNIRRESLSYLSKKMKCNTLSVDYEELQIEIFKRLVNNDLISKKIKRKDFIKYFELADYEAVVGVQTVNTSLCSQLAELAKKGIRIFLVSDINLSKEIIRKILSYHGLEDLFEAIYLSCLEKKSKYVGDLYPYIISTKNIDTDQVIMVGDNKRTDILNAEKYGLFSLHIPNSSIKLKNKLQLFGNEANDFKKACSSVVKRCRRSDFVFSEYLIHYYFFVERVYLHAKKNNIHNLFF